MVTTAADTGFLGVLAAIVIAVLIWGTWAFWRQLQRTRQMWPDLNRLVDPFHRREHKAVRQALHAHDQDMDALMQAAGLPPDKFETALREWQARQ